MSAAHPCEIPQNSLLCKYKDGVGYADCYVVQVPGAVSQQHFVEAFYTSPLFKIERTLLKYLASKPADDAAVKELASGKATEFSAWRVQAQSASELLLADFSGRTKSWLMAVPGTATSTTHLYFGSAVVARRASDGRLSLGWLFHALLGFHRLYSRLLLNAASRRVNLR